MAEEGEIDIEGDFDFKTDYGSDIYDANELPSKSANLLPEYTSPAWMLEQGWTMDSCMDEKSKATIEKMLQEEQYYINGKGKSRGGKGSGMRKTSTKPQSQKQPWTEEEKLCFCRGLEIFGRSWTKIAELIPSRSVLQVKNYAQQYFKQKAKVMQNGEGIDLIDMNSSENSNPSVATSSHNSVQLTQPDTGAAVKSPKVKSSARGSRNILLKKTQTNKKENDVIEKDTSFDPLKEVIASVTTAKTTITTLSPTVSKTRPSPVSMTLTQSIGQVSNSALLAQLRSQVQNHKSNKQNYRNLECDLNLSSSSTCSESSSKNNSPQSKPAKVTVIKTKKETKCQKIDSIPVPRTPEKKNLNVIVDTKKLQLSPTLENKLASSTGIIENLDRFCAVADIITEGADVEDDEEIDIENDDDMEENPILQNRSASPNSVYEKLLKAANANKRSNVIKKVNQRLETSICTSTKGNSKDEDVDVAKKEIIETTGVCENQHGAILMCSEADIEEDWSTESNENQNKPCNAIVLTNGEVWEFPVPKEEKVLQAKEIVDEEKKLHSEFFDGRPLKTPERYLRIRNYIIDCWRKCKPSYLNKTSVRPGLKNCGDVNVIGRIHAYLECIGVINFGCDQACYNNPSKPLATGSRDKLPREDIPICTAKLDSMRPRKRRIRDAYGLWIDEREAQGKTIEHVEGEITSEIPVKQKTNRIGRVNYDPFKLIPCQTFTEENAAPFVLEIHNSALVMMDLHAHVSKTEVIGLLGGVYDASLGKLEVYMAVPCNSISTGMQCEMDPVSQTEACEKIIFRKYNVIGWYHSHPAFPPNPSIRDIETQLKFQDWFSKEGFTYIGMIVSPYNRMNNGMVSEFQCLTISQEKSATDPCNIPYSFDYQVTILPLEEGEMIEQARAIADKYSSYPHRVELLGMYRSSTGITCLDKMIESLRDSMIPNSEESQCLLNMIYDIFSRAFICDKQDFIDPEIVFEEEINSMEIDNSQSRVVENLELGITMMDDTGIMNGNDLLTSKEEVVCGGI